MCSVWLWVLLKADMRVEMPEGCITSSHKSFRQGRAVSVFDISPNGPEEKCVCDNPAADWTHLASMWYFYRACQLNTILIQSV